MFNHLKSSVRVFLALIGVDPRKILYFRYFHRYLSDYLKFKKAGGYVTNYFPILDDFAAQAGAASGHYFHQDLLVASFIHSANPVRHIDIGSRIDGFVAHVAAFREIEVMDVRDLKDTGHANIKFFRADLMVEDACNARIADSVSCLHAIEHFGLGRYGDPVDPAGHIKGFNNILKMIRDNGILYISVPIGAGNRVCFNAHRVFHPTDILGWANETHKLELLRFDYVDDAGDLHKDCQLSSIAPRPLYGCGIYTFRKCS